MIPLIRSTSCACASLRRASRAVCHLYDLVLAPTHMKATQFMILQAIAESGQIAQCDLARDLAASVETLSRRLASARRAGLVDSHAGDRRKQMYSLTAKGRKLLDEALPYWERAEERLQASFDGPDWEMLAGFTDRLTAAAIRAESLPVSNRGGVHKLRAAGLDL